MSYVLAFLNMLVETRVFRKIELGFLLVGHSHDLRIDQIFNRFSKKCPTHIAVPLSPELLVPKEWSHFI